VSADDQQGIRDRLQRGGEEALGKLVQDLIENPVVTGTLSRAFEARERASQAQEAAMGAMNLPSAGDVARLTRRVRSVGQRLEGVEDALDRIDSRLGTPGTGDVEQRLEAIEQALTRLEQSAAAKPAAKPATTRSKPAAKSAAKKAPAKSRSTRKAPAGRSTARAAKKS